MSDAGPGTRGEGEDAARTGAAGEGGTASLRGRESSSRAMLPFLMFFVLAGVIFSTGINWGLPSRAVDKFLFGDRPAWPGEKIQKLAGGWSDDPARGADVDADPLAKQSEPVLLNGTDTQRAQIIRRYRLYTYQPDEMITMRALSGMRPSEGKLDPRLYQYGGLWIYPVGALLKLASAEGMITLKADVPWYLDHPEEFGKFYIVARVYTVLWGLVGLAAVVWITRRLTRGQTLPALFAGFCYVCMPVVINMAHEAKPHLPGAVLQLLAIMAAMRYVETGRRAWWLGTAVLCGAAFGMVLSAWPVFIVLPIMVVLRSQSWSRRVGLAVGGGAIGVGTYLLANPYIVINLFINREVLRSNFGNSLAMYAIGRWPEGVVNATRLVGEGASVAVLIIGLLTVVIGVVLHVVAARRRRANPANPAEAAPSRAIVTPEAKDWLLLAGPVVLILAQFIALAAGKPGEYGRFAVLPDVALGIAAVVGISRVLPDRAGQTTGLALLLLLVAIPGYGYLSGFIADSGNKPSRFQLGSDLFLLNEEGARTLAVFAEPAPYDLPPVNLFAWQIYLVPEGYRFESGELPADAVVRVVDEAAGAGTPPEGYIPGLVKNSQFRTRISWADKPIVVWVLRSLVRTEMQPATVPSSDSF